MNATSRYPAFDYVISGRAADEASDHSRAGATLADIAEDLFFEFIASSPRFRHRDCISADDSMTTSSTPRSARSSHEAKYRVSDKRRISAGYI